MFIHAFFLITISTQALAQSSTNWLGWSNIKHVFSFGDSYTDTGFKINETQPNPSNPFGNPAFPGRTFSNGRNWLDFLAYSYNESQVFVYNAARGGETIDSFGKTNVRSFDRQVEKFWKPNYGLEVTTPVNLTAPGPVWKGSDALFAVFFGINDIKISLSRSEEERTTFLASTWNTYARILNVLYDSGARNFLLMNVPAIHRSPEIRGKGKADATLAAIKEWNNRLQSMMNDFTKNRTDATTFLLDNFDLYSAVLDDAKSRPETSGYTNTTDFCPQYLNRNYNESTFNSRCGVPQSQYFWLDSLHTTPPIHKAMAASIATLLNATSPSAAKASTSFCTRTTSQATSGSSRISGAADYQVLALVVMASLITTVLFV